MITGSTSGRSPERLRKNRCKSTRILSLMSPGSVRSSTPAPSSVDARSAGISLSSASVRVSSNESTSDHVRRFLEVARLTADGHDGDHQPVACQVPPIPENFVSDFTTSRPVDENPAGRDLAGQPPAILVEPDEVTVFGQKDLRVSRHTGSHPGMPGKLAVLPVYRHEEARPDQGKHQFQLFLAAMPGHVDVFDPLVNDLGPPPGDVVHHPANRLLVAWNFTRGEDDDVFALQSDVPVVVDRDPGEGRLGLALGPRANTDKVLGRKASDVAVPNLNPGRNPEVAQPLGDLRVLDDAASDESHPSIELRREVHENLHPVDARRERRHDDLPLGVGEDLLERVDDIDFGSRESATIDVRAVREERQHACRPELGQPVKIHVLAIDRRLIDLEIPRMNHDPVGRLDRERHAIGHAVGHTQELDRERADGDALARPHRHQTLLDLLAVFLELGFDKRERQRRAIHRALHDRQHMRDRPDVILVPVRQDERRDPILLELPQIRDDEVDAEQLGLGKHHAGIDQDGRVTAGDDHHVHAELPEAAERDDFQRWRVSRRVHAGKRVRTASDG